MIRPLMLLFNNIGMTFENTILLVVNIGCLMMYAKDFKLGMIIQMLGNGLLFLWFYTGNYDYSTALIAMLINLVILSISLYATAKTEARGAII